MKTLGEQKTNHLTGEPPVSEHPVYGFGDLHLSPRRGSSCSKTSSGGCISSNPTCCAELCPEHYSLLPETLRAARKMMEAAIWG